MRQNRDPIIDWKTFCTPCLQITSNDLGTFNDDYLGETAAPTAEHLKGMLRALTTYHYEKEAHGGLLQDRINTPAPLTPQPIPALAPHPAANDRLPCAIRPQDGDLAYR